MAVNSIRSPVPKPIPVPKLPEVTRCSSDLLADFLRLKISANTRRNYSLDVGDFDKSGRLSILGKGKIQTSQIDLSPATTIAISQWLTARDNYRSSDPPSCCTSTVGEIDRSAPLFTSLDRRSKRHRLDANDFDVIYCFLNRTDRQHFPSGSIRAVRLLLGAKAEAPKDLDPAN